MGQDRGLWFATQRLSSLSSLALSHLGKQDSNLISKPCGKTNKFSTFGSYPVSQSHFDGSLGWIHGSFHSQQQFLLPQNPCTNQMPLQVEGQCSQKRFLVFDQSGDQTTIRKSIEALKQPDLKEEPQRSNKNLIVYQGVQGNSEPDLKEDTEELNALLYSEDECEYCSEEDEVTSSSHSPSTLVSAHGEHRTYSESNGQYVKKRKIIESSTPFLETSNENMRDAESSCGSCENRGIDFLKYSMMLNNKIGEEKIFETVSLLRSIVPGEELVDPILVIDRAIDYLKSLKMEAEKSKTRDSLFA
ncbi:Transcription factor [Cardamine amara subsp. amara]|uniref:Transcription factor n=1 Tax=Cardamine amara subsp. amara TaxID=228776 RepID=A0ABD1AM38_CARAN